MTFVDHLKGAKVDNRYLEVAFGRHAIEGDLAKSDVTGSSPNHVVTIQQMLGDAFGKGWKGPVGIWFRGTNRPSAKFKFYPGIMSPGNSDTTQGIDTVFNLDTPHSNSAWIRVECPNGSEVGIPDINTKDNPPTGLAGIYECQLGDIYDSSGNVASSSQYLTNPADVIAFGCIEIRRYPTSRIDWASLATLRAACDQLVTPDFTTLPEGVGLTGRYYDGTAFNTLKSKRVDPAIQYDLSTGAPALDISPTGFSVRFEGKIRFKYSETYTFYLTHNDGGRLWIGNLSTPIIDQWGTTGEHSATFAATADTFYDIKIEWNNAAGDSQLKLEWQSTSQTRQVVPQDRLYPKNESQKRFECHVAFTQPTTFDDFLRSVLFTCNGGYQDVDGKLVFFCIDDLSPAFTFDETNIVKNTFKYYPRFSQQDLLSLPNRFVADGRDLDSRYLEKFDPPLFYDLPELQEIAGRVIEETILVGNTTRWQALTNLAHYAKLRTAPVVAEFDGMPQTFKVLQGDLVNVTHSMSGWGNKRFLTVEATDKSTDKDSDNRIFKLLQWDLPPSNVALASAGSTATASSSLNSNCLPDRTIDGYRHTNNAWNNGAGAGGGWNSNGGMPGSEWVEVNFNTTRTINEIDVITLADAIQYTTEPTLTDVFTFYGIVNFKTQYWNGSAWVDINNITANNKVWRKFTFSPISTTKIRVLVTQGIDTSARIIEIQAWGY